MLNYKISGSGPLCVFIHGFLESMNMWHYLPLDELNCRKLIIDLPGHGNSALSDSNKPSIDFMAEEIVSILNKEKVDDFNVVGHSMGGYVALLLKEKMPSCSKVIMLNSNYWSDSPTKKKDRERVSKIAFKAKNYFIQEAIPNLFSDQLEYKAEIQELILEAKLISPEAISYAALAMKDRLDQSKILNSDDFIFIHGELDSLVDKAMFDLEIIKSTHFHEISNAGHMSYIENHGEVIDVLKLYLID
ncbi:alpha/beta hydrolase [Crocinitomicaceae bacterium]|nr:alpha/beta hydrolase [Crocinitomicaceae bacterium]MDC1244084.1 alpha/beta hydrolase [Crocinitomicaceae bacterium]MDC1361570.1 alpha/beta hydrolase [Crocinitomicaceae bacterium]